MPLTAAAIEAYEKDKVATLRRRGHIHDVRQLDALLILTPRQVKYPYDLGFVRNIASVLGQRTLWWCWPQRMQGDGLSFPTSAGVGKWLDAQSAGRVSSIEPSDAV